MPLRIACPAFGIPIRIPIRTAVHSGYTPLAQRACYAASAKAPEEPSTAKLSPRWLSDLKSRIGKCIMFGMSEQQTKEASLILQEIALDWRELVAGSEGFLTTRDRRGLYRQQVVWGEMLQPTTSSIGTIIDCVTGHVNNVVYPRYAESARCNWALNYAHIDPAHKNEWSQILTNKGVGLILRSIKIDFKFPMAWPDHVTVLHKLRSEVTPDTDHFILDVLILSELHRRPAARCIEDIVVYDYNQARKAPLKPFMVDRFKETWELQQHAKKEYSSRVSNLMSRVRQLEKGSWDRPDAKEDFGSAANP